MPVTRSSRNKTTNVAEDTSKPVPPVKSRIKKTNVKKQSFQEEKACSPAVDQVPKSRVLRSRSVVKTTERNDQGDLKTSMSPQQRRASKPKLPETGVKTSLQTTTPVRRAAKKSPILQTELTCKGTISSVAPQNDKLPSNSKASVALNTSKHIPFADKRPNVNSPDSCSVKAPLPLITPGIKRVMNSWTPTMDKRKVASQDTFKGRLDWKMRQYGMPVTSTPKANETSISKKDIDTCFGFDESEEENNYSALISPIAFTRKLQDWQKKVTSTKPVKADDNQGVLQESNSNDNIKAPLLNSNECTDKNPIPSSSKGVVSLDKKPTKKPASKNAPIKKSKNFTSRKNKLNIKTDPEIEKGRCASPHLYEFDELLSSQKLENEISETAPSNCDSSSEQLFVKRSGDGAEFNALLARYGKVDDDCDLHFDSGKIRKTYASKKRQKPGFALLGPTTPKKTRKTNKRTVLRNNVQENEDSDESDEMDLKTKEWLEQKNKEFDEVLHVPLIFTKSVSSTKHNLP